VKPSNNKVHPSTLGQGDPHVRGRVHRRFSAKRGTSRLRFAPVHIDQEATILLALERARLLGNTEFDTVALELICMNFLTTT
jgi:hypothetical protein